MPSGCAFDENLQEGEKKALSESRLSRSFIHRAGNCSHTPMLLYLCALSSSYQAGNRPVGSALSWKRSHQDPDSGCGRLPNADLVCLVAARLLTRVINATQTNRFHPIRGYFCLNLISFAAWKKNMDSQQEGQGFDSQGCLCPSEVRLLHVAARPRSQFFLLQNNYSNKII